MGNRITVLVPIYIRARTCWESCGVNLPANKKGPQRDQLGSKWVKVDTHLIPKQTSGMGGYRLLPDPVYWVGNGCW